MKKVIRVMLAAALLMVLAACAKKADVRFSDLKLGTGKQELVKMLGKDYTEVGTSPYRMIYTGVSLFDFIGKNADTKLTINMNTEDNAYAYSYYMYKNLDSNYEKAKSYFEGLYGTAAEGQNASEIWIDGDHTYYLFKQPDYVAVGVN